MSSWPYTIKNGGFHVRQWNDPARKKPEPRRDWHEPEGTTKHCRIPLSGGGISGKNSNGAFRMLTKARRELVLDEGTQ